MKGRFGLLAGKVLVDALGRSRQLRMVRIQLAGSIQVLVGFALGKGYTCQPQVGGGIVRIVRQRFEKGRSSFFHVPAAHSKHTLRAQRGRSVSPVR